MSYAVRRLYHTTHWVPDLEEAASFFAQVFGRESKSLPDFLGLDERTLDAGYPVNYCRFTPIAEVLFDSVDPELHLVDGLQPYESVTEPHLGAIAWFVDGIEDLWTELRRLHIRGTDQGRNEPQGEGPPLDISSTPIIFTVPNDTGLAYELCPYFAQRDPRGDPPEPAIDSNDPLGIVRCSHHTVLTDRPDQGRRLLVDVLGGWVIHEGRNEVLATDSTYIALAEGVYELARPLEDDSPAMKDWQRSAPEDTYHALTWQVGDLDQVADHLKASGAGLRVHTDTVIVTEAADTLGVPWGFTTVLTPGDSRA